MVLGLKKQDESETDKKEESRGASSASVRKECDDNSTAILIFQ
jgi:hypothetical protein